MLSKTENRNFSQRMHCSPNSESNTQFTAKELEIELQELDDKWHFCSLEKLFIEERIYRKIETKTSWNPSLKQSKPA